MAIPRSTNSEGGDSGCRAVYKPVCGLVEDNGQYRYQTFGNSCIANGEGANISFETRCNSLEDKISEAFQPAIVHDTTAKMPEAADGVTVLDGEISQDVAKLTLEHSGGCDEHRFDLHVAPPFMESWPLQISARLTHNTEDNCDSVVITHVSIDLLPLKRLYRINYDSESGEIMIPHAGLYRF